MVRKALQTNIITEQPLPHPGDPNRITSRILAIAELLPEEKIQRLRAKLSPKQCTVIIVPMHFFILANNYCLKSHTFHVWSLKTTVGVHGSSKNRVIGIQKLKTQV